MYVSAKIQKNVFSETSIHSYIKNGRRQFKSQLCSFAIAKHFKWGPLKDFLVFFFKLLLDPENTSKAHYNTICFSTEFGIMQICFGPSMFSWSYFLIPGPIKEYRAVSCTLCVRKDPLDTGKQNPSLGRASDFMSESKSARPNCQEPPESHKATGDLGGVLCNCTAFLGVGKELGNEKRRLGDTQSNTSGAQSHLCSSHSDFDSVFECDMLTLQPGN